MANTHTSRKWRLGPYHRDETVRDEDGSIRFEVVTGVRIRDEARGITYRVTIGRGNGRVWLRTLEIEPDDQDDPGVGVALLRRVPAASLADYAARWLAERERLQAEAVQHEDDTEPSDEVRTTVRRAQRRASTPGALWKSSERSSITIPTPAEVAAMLRAGETRQTLAARYNRSPVTISAWIGAAYREVPEQMPPRRRGRLPGVKAQQQTPDKP